MRQRKENFEKKYQHVNEAGAPLVLRTKKHEKIRGVLTAFDKNTYIICLEIQMIKFSSFKERFVFKSKKYRTLSRIKLTLIHLSYSIRHLIPSIRKLIQEDQHCIVLMAAGREGRR